MSHNSVIGGVSVVATVQRYADMIRANTRNAMIPRTGDYRRLPASVHSELAERAARINDILRGSVLEVGRELIEAKKLLAHGEFGRWIEREVGMSRRWAHGRILSDRRRSAQQGVSVRNFASRKPSPSAPGESARAIIESLANGISVMNAVALVKHGNCEWS